MQQDSSMAWATASTSITNATRGWGQGVAAYGNDIKDVVGAGGPRVATAANPLGIAGAGGARATLGSTSKAPAKKGTGSNPLGL
ncbi:hypothetical protein AMS68_001265 [Peltaster fructicola]|uniref:Uncharacterized protein n=1 Tax=Peltaster fructicola TaxID=286661 RepID=A0A6H0XM99_9PEZI|nr:hypothetical protein AMS68_001265 [Peltaster fructicola]